MEDLKNYLNRHFDNYHDTSAKKCNETILSKPAPDDGLYCPAVVDDWGNCFNYTKAGTTAYLPCPAISVLNRDGFSFRHCEENGTWQIVVNDKPWTNTSVCSHNVSFHEDMFDPSTSYIYVFIAGASLSLVLVTMSLVIFHGFRQLRCDRITVHKNLFISYVLAALTWILYYRFVALDGFVMLQNPLWCRLLHVIGQYFATTNFTWMFCEGLYLHMIMARALTTSKTLIKWLAIVGWGVPFLLTSVYAGVKAAQSEEVQNCWIEDDALMWIIAAPVAVSIIINFCILVNLVLLLRTKLKQVPNINENRKAAKATLILVPLFGLQFLVFPIRPASDSSLYPVYLYFMSLLMSLQGTVVSFIFCFCNREEEIELKDGPVVTTPLVEKDKINEIDITQTIDCIT